MTRQTLDTATKELERKNAGTQAIEQYKADFALVLPTHVRPEVWTRLAVGALRRDQKLRDAANNDVGALMNALLEAARLGHEPGSSAYYLVPRREKGVWKVQGIEGYRGIIARMMRAGSATSVVVREVRANDEFSYYPDQDRVPHHRPDWFGGDRGDLIGVYAYATLQGDAVSQIVILDRNDVMAAKAKSDGSDSPYSPWKTNEVAMWRKTAIRRLEPFVDTSAEYRTVQLRAELAATEPAGPAADLPPLTPVDRDDEIVDAEVIPDQQQAEQ